MINKHYRQAALETYGEQCEICGNRTALEVHHIDYQEQWEMESKLRAATKNKSSELQTLLKEAKEMGYDEFSKNQLAKNDDTKNLAVLCGNDHFLVHALDSGKKLLNVLKERK